MDEASALNLVEYPLTAMECSVMDERYMNLPRDEALRYMLKLKQACRKHGGVFTLLWHNSRFVDDAEVELYRRVVAG